VTQADDKVRAAPLRVGWIAGRGTLWQLGHVLGPLAIGLMDELIELVVLCPPGAGPGELPSPPLEVLEYARPLWRPGAGRSVDRIAAGLRERKVDLLHALDSSAAKLTAALARALGLPYVVSKHRFGSGRLKHLRPPPEAVLASCEIIRAGLLKRRVVPEEQVHLVRPGVHQVAEPTCFTTPERSVAVVIGGSGASDGDLACVLGSLGELHQRRYDCVYFIVNAGRAEKSLRRQVERLGLRHELTFVDQQSPKQMVGIFKAADVYIAPVVTGWLDVRTLLAMAAGIPVLTCLDAEDFVIDGRTVIRFRRSDTADLTVKLLSLVDDPGAAQDLARSALAYVGEHHRPAEMVSAVADIYRAAAPPKG